ncbi:GNAT family N-acetyltransferase [Saccharospirillum impatiens]|uniref:GNAT family N-acetyltransferase n=1 Tax=Saccharospirillum impatiens TaxID=169438 RepID=UPI0004116981|nr:GNAT family N-acetyltransferase [Saccharospirillum impatiens]
MKIIAVSKSRCLDLLPLFIELEKYYFKEQAASDNELKSYLEERVFSEQSGVKAIAAYEGSQVLGFATFTIMYPAPKLSGQMYMKDLFISSKARGQGIGVSLMKHLAKLARDNGCYRLDWTAESTNPDAGNFYQSIGAMQVQEKEYYRFEGSALVSFAQ